MPVRGAIVRNSALLNKPSRTMAQMRTYWYWGSSDPLRLVGGILSPDINVHAHKHMLAYMRTYTYIHEPWAMSP